MKKITTVNIRMDMPLKLALEERALRERRTVSDLARLLLEDELTRLGDLKPATVKGAE